ncbi:MAG: hypothetical protein AAF702_29095 [Chloroflexota bacterium]
MQFDEPISAADFLAIWKAADEELGNASTATGEVRPIERGRLLGPRITPGRSGGVPDMAGEASRFTPQNAMRMLTVWKMKDRAGLVGSKGLGQLLAQILKHSDGRVHLVGHSYGCKVILSALCEGETIPRNASSMLLLQPAVNHLCFAAEVPGSGKAGGYRKALERVEQPILSTYSEQDWPLHKFFHRALRRRKDLFELRIALDGQPPSHYAALGGYGPRGCDEVLIPIKAAGDHYDLNADSQIIGLDGTSVIKGHGDISQVATWWALYDLVRPKA